LLRPLLVGTRLRLVRRLGRRRRPLLGPTLWIRLGPILWIRLLRRMHVRTIRRTPDTSPENAGEYRR
ncbi:hypothetical protein ACFQ08_11540, partial [Streptosporangium algeriense]